MSFDKLIGLQPVRVQSSSHLIGQFPRSYLIPILEKIWGVGSLPASRS